VVPKPDTVVDPGAVVVETSGSLPTRRSVMGSNRSCYLALAANPTVDKLQTTLPYVAGV
jgi:hypothetical protein